MFAYIERHGLTLPMQYGEGYADSIECLPCPAPMKAARLRYLRRHHPEMAEVATKAAGGAINAVLAEAGRIITITHQQESA